MIRGLPTARSLRLVFLLVACALVVACDKYRLARDVEPTPRPDQPEAVDPRITADAVANVPAIPHEIERAAHEWPLGNADYANTRATFTAAIDSSNVDRLAPAWSLPIEGASEWGSAASNPVILDGIVYFQSLRTDVTAIELETGDLVWSRVYQQKSFGPNGPSVGWGKVFIQDGERSVIALDMESGEEVWRQPMQGPTGAHQPTPFGGMLFTAISAAGLVGEGADEVLSVELNAGGTSGHIYGMNQADGELIWRFQTVEEGFWGNPEVNSGGGVWFPGAIDTETGMTFWATGNPGPIAGTVDWPNGSSRPGDNLYTCSMLAIDGRTGELVWYNQVWPHDLFNYDFQNPPILASVEVDGAERDIVIGSGKMGRIYGFDRETGELLWETPVGIHQNDELRELPLDEPVEVYPGFWGGIETPAAYADGVVYAITVNLPTLYTATAWDAEDGAETVDNLEGRTVYEEGHSELVAVDATNGELLWSTPFPSIGFGGATVVNDLVFTATYDGQIYAVTREDGEVVWDYLAPGGIIAWPAVSGEFLVWPIGLGRTPQLLAFRLDGELDPDRPAGIPGPVGTPEPMTTPTPVLPPPAPTLVPAPVEEDGEDEAPDDAGPPTSGTPP